MKLHLWANLRQTSWNRPLHLWCGEPCSLGSRDDHLACLRIAGHGGKHIPLFRDAVFADRYANTSGYRRQRRRHGILVWPPRNDRLMMNALLHAAAQELELNPEPWP